MTAIVEPAETAVTAEPAVTAEAVTDCAHAQVAAASDRRAARRSLSGGLDAP